MRVECTVGIYPNEREQVQPLEIDAELDYDFAQAAKTDKIGNAVDYDHVAKLLKNLAVERRFKLLETYAEEAAAALFCRFEVVQAVRLEIRKPKAVAAAQASFVRVGRSR